MNRIIIFKLINKTIIRYLTLTSKDIILEYVQKKIKGKKLCKIWNKITKLIKYS